MSVQILGKGKKVALKRRHARLRKHISGTPELPRLVVTRSNRHMVALVSPRSCSIVAATSIMAAAQLSLKAPAREVWHCERQRKGNPSG